MSGEKKEEVPKWIQKLNDRQLELNDAYEQALDLISTKYNDFILEINRVNKKHGTSFTAQEIVELYGGEEVYIEDDDDEYEDYEYEFDDDDYEDEINQELKDEQFKDELMNS